MATLLTVRKSPAGFEWETPRSSWTSPATTSSVTRATLPTSGSTLPQRVMLAKCQEKKSIQLPTGRPLEELHQEMPLQNKRGIKEHVDPSRNTVFWRTAMFKANVTHTKQRCTVFEQFLRHVRRVKGQFPTM